MSNRCDICGKGSLKGQNVKRRGRAKSKGGAGRKITGRSKRVQKANIQKVKAFYNGKKQRIKVCTNCLKSDKIVRAY